LNPIYATWNLKGHNGVDWSCTYGEPIYWDCDIRGTVVETSNDAAAGVGCDIITEDKDGIFKHTFWHFKLNGLVVQAGQVLESGNLIGYGDSTGMSTGNHLHRQIKPEGKNSVGSYYNLEPDNGYAGAVDPTPYFINIFIKDYMATLQSQIDILTKMIEIIKKILALKIQIKVGN